MSRRIAMCPKCRVPVVMTLAFSGAEFYCLDCGGTFGWLDPAGVEPTPELLADMEARKAEWVENAGRKLLVYGARLTDCNLCAEGHEHWRHTTTVEREADKAAREWLAQRVKS